MVRTPSFLQFFPPCLSVGTLRPKGRYRVAKTLMLQVIFRKRATNYRARLRKMSYKDKASCGSSAPCTLLGLDRIKHRVSRRVCCSVLQCVAGSVLQCVAVCCSVLQCVAVRCSVLQCVAVRCNVLQCVAMCCSASQCVAMCCSVLQCVAVCCREEPKSDLY